jgi:hypothetical protein
MRRWLTLPSGITADFYVQRTIFFAYDEHAIGHTWSFLKEVILRFGGKQM